MPLSSAKSRNIKYTFYKIPNGNSEPLNYGTCLVTSSALTICSRVGGANFTSASSSSHLKYSKRYPLQFYWSDLLSEISTRASKRQAINMNCRDKYSSCGSPTLVGHNIQFYRLKPSGWQVRSSCSSLQWKLLNYYNFVYVYRNLINTMVVALK